MVDSFRFLTLFAAAIAAWIVLMWFTLAAVSASESRSDDRYLAPVTPDAPAAPASGAAEPAQPVEAIGAGWIFNAGLPATSTAEGGAA